MTCHKIVASIILFFFPTSSKLQNLDVFPTQLLMVTTQRPTGIPVPKIQIYYIYESIWVITQGVDVIS